MTRYNEIPTDSEVCRVLEGIGPVSAIALVEALEADKNGGHSRRDAQRAVQRCLDRGKIVLGVGMRISVAARELEAA